MSEIKSIPKIFKFGQRSFNFNAKSGEIPGFEFQYFSSNGNVRLYADSGKIIIGNYNSFNSNVFLGGSGGEIITGDNVLIGPNCVLRASDHKFRKDQIIRNQGHVSGKIIIEDDVWLGANVIILKDVIIKKGSIIGAGSVVTKSTEEYSINAGVPAKKISERV